MDQIMFLSEEMDKLKKGFSGGAPPASAAGGSGNRELEEKIRRLELELEEARSG
jgi:hypothetical protein